MKFLERHKHSLLITALVVILLLLASLIYISKVDKYYSKINGIATTRTFYQNLEKYYQFQDAKNKVNKTLSSYADTAKNAIISNNAYVSEAKIAGLDYSQAATDKYMKQYYDINGGKEQYYHYVSTQYGESKEIANYINQTDYLKNYFSDKLFSKNLIFGVTMRWDPFLHETPEIDNSIKSKLSNQFLPLFNSGASNDFIKEQTDAYKMDNNIEKTSVGFPTSYTYINNLVDERSSSTMFANFGGGGISNYEAISKLTKIGQNTGVFKSTVGYFAIFRLEKSSNGKYLTERNLIDHYSKNVIYFKTLGDVLNNIKAIIAKPFAYIFGAKVYAASLDYGSCFNKNGGHVYSVGIQFKDSNSGQIVSPSNATLKEHYQQNGGSFTYDSASLKGCWDYDSQGTNMPLQSITGSDNSNSSITINCAQNPCKNGAESATSTFVGGTTKNFMTIGVNCLVGGNNKFLEISPPSGYNLDLANSPQAVDSMVSGTTNYNYASGSSSSLATVDRAVLLNSSDNGANGSITIYVKSAKVDIKGLVYYYNGSDSRGLSGVQITGANNCTYNATATTDDTGYYTKSKNIGADFCLRVPQVFTDPKNGNLLSNVVITPDYIKGASPPGGSLPIGVKDHCKTNYIFYDSQSAGSKQSPGACNYNLGNNTGYNFAYTSADHKPSIGSPVCDVNDNLTAIIADTDASSNTNISYTIGQLNSSGGYTQVYNTKTISNGGNLNYDLSRTLYGNGKYNKYQISVTDYNTASSARFENVTTIINCPVRVVYTCLSPTFSNRTPNTVTVNTSVGFSEQPSTAAFPGSSNFIVGIAGSFTINFLGSSSVVNGSLSGSNLIGSADRTLSNAPGIDSANFTFASTLPSSGITYPDFSTCTSSFTIYSKPFFKVIGGDVITGTKIGAPVGSCTDTDISNDPDGILAWNTNSSSFNGSGTTMAAQALGQIIGFVSNQNSTATGNELTFSNVGYSSPIYGGLFGTAPCGPDLSSYGSMTPSGNPGTISSVSTGTKAYNSNLQISSLNIINGTQATIYTTGDVFISGDIKYNTAGWTDASQIPNLKIIAKNIYIDSSVHNLDGIYIATGDIKDCADKLGHHQEQACYGTSTSPNTLTVNGSFMANQIYLERTGGNIDV
ncbi:MAG: hypothetical protein WCJ05_00825, partial [bacterium]